MSSSAGYVLLTIYYCCAHPINQRLLAGHLRCFWKNLHAYRLWSTLLCNKLMLSCCSMAAMNCASWSHNLCCLHCHAPALFTAGQLQPYLHGSAYDARL